MNAHFRRSGPMKDMRKETSKQACRDFDLHDQVWDDLHEEEVRLIWCESMSQQYWGDGYDIVKHCYCSTHQEEFREYLRRNK